VRANRFGGQFIGCKGYPDCKVTYNLPARGRIQFREDPCAECGAPYLLHDDRGRKQEHCVNPGCPTRAAAMEIEKMALGTCPNCKSGTLQVTRSRNYKRFVKCDNPACMAPNGKGPQTYPLPQRGEIVYEGVVCPTCTSPRIMVLTKGRKPWDICVNMECPSNERERGARAQGGARTSRSPEGGLEGGPSNKKEEKGKKAGGEEPEGKAEGEEVIAKPKRKGAKAA
jgi:DNA topoisomerase-1